MDHDFEWHTREEKDAVVRYWWRKQRMRCHICHEQMEPYSRAIISPWAATIEHLIPQRENGPNTVGNVRLAHRWCNNVLGALWEMNRSRALKGLEPLSQQWALSNELGKLSAARSAAAHRVTVTQPKKLPVPQASLAAMERDGRYPLPRGGTLPAGAIPPIFEHSRDKPARRMSALEVAQFLRQSAEKKGHPWPLA